MSAETFPRGRRKEPRYQVADRNAIRVVLVGPNEHASPVSAELVDMSCSGMRLSIAGRSPIRKGERVQIQLTVSSTAFSLEIDSTVCWLTPGVGSGWFVGCTLTEPILRQHIDELARGGVLERRADERNLLSLDVQGKSELGGSYHPMRIVNYSGGGFCLVAPDLLAHPGERIMIRVGTHGDTKAIRAKVIWAKNLSDHYSIGCQFLTQVDHQQFRKFSQHPLTCQNPVPVFGKLKSRGNLIAIGVTLLLSAAIVWNYSSATERLRRFVALPLPAEMHPPSQHGTEPTALSPPSADRQSSSPDAAARRDRSSVDENRNIPLVEH